MSTKMLQCWTAQNSQFYSCYKADFLSVEGSETPSAAADDLEQCGRQTGLISATCW